MQVIAMRMRTSHKSKLPDNIASMSLIILIDDFQPHMQWNISIAIINTKLVKEGSFRINAKLVKKELIYYVKEPGKRVFTLIKCQNNIKSSITS